MGLTLLVSIGGNTFCIAFVTWQTVKSVLKDITKFLKFLSVALYYDNFDKRCMDLGALLDDSSSYVTIKMLRSEIFCKVHRMTSNWPQPIWHEKYPTYIIHNITGPNSIEPP